MPRACQLSPPKRAKQPQSIKVSRLERISTFDNGGPVRPTQPDLSTNNLLRGWVIRLMPRLYSSSSFLRPFSIFGAVHRFCYYTVVRLALLACCGNFGHRLAYSLSQSTPIHLAFISTCFAREPHWSSRAARAPSPAVDFPSSTRPPPPFMSCLTLHRHTRCSALRPPHCNRQSYRATSARRAPKHNHPSPRRVSPPGLSRRLRFGFSPTILEQKLAAPSIPGQQA